MKRIANRMSRWGLGICASLSVATVAIAQRHTADAFENRDLRRHWNAAFDVVLPHGVASDDLKARCWTRRALVSYVTEGRFWIEDIYGLPDGYVESHCLREQLSTINLALNVSYKQRLQSLTPAQRRQLIASERL